VQAWQDIAETHAPDGTLLELRRRGDEFLIRSGGFDLMSSEDAASSRSLATLGCAHIDKERPGRVLIGGLGMGFTAQAALGATGPKTAIDVAELVPAVAEWNGNVIAELAGRPLDNPRVTLIIDDVSEVIENVRGAYDAILLDVDNGPDSLAHDSNDRLYGNAGIAAARRALRPEGVLAIWSFSDDTTFTRRLKAEGYRVRVEKVTGSARGRGRYHHIWVATAPRKART
jgi:spermidine synthase